jgi:hypothetical protein
MLLAVPTLSANADTTAPAATPTAPAAPVAPAPAKPANRATGAITAFDATAKTLTLTERNGTSATVTLDPAAVIIVHSHGTLADLKAGDTVRVNSAAEITEGATTVDATEISVVPAGAPEPGKGKSKRPVTGYRKRSVEGTVATVTPLTITTPGNVTVTVNTTATTRVALAHVGTTADLVVGDNAQAQLTTTATGTVAKTVNVMPAPKTEKRGKLKK